MYKIKEIYYTLQGEGHHTGRPAVFCRFSGCNLWSGREEDRASAICQFCDTNFWGLDGVLGGKYNTETLVETISQLWPDHHKTNPFVVFTGGEPALQLDSELIDACHTSHIEVAVETNGTLELPNGIDWICVSPKANTDIVIKSGNEIKIVFPQKGIDPIDFKDLQFEHYYIQPMDGNHTAANTQAAIDFCKSNPQWKLSIQTHKLLNIP